MSIIWGVNAWRIILLVLSIGVYTACAQPTTIQVAPATRTLDFKAPRVVYYLAPPGLERGGLNELSAWSNEWTRVVSWQDLKNAARARPGDAIIADVSFLTQAAEEDRRWLRAQFDDGVVIGSVGATLDELARAINTQTIKDPNEEEPPNAAFLYLHVYEFIQAPPQDYPRMQRQYPDATFTRELNPVQGKASASAGRALRRLDDPVEFQDLFSSLNMTIDSIRQARAEFEPPQGFRPLFEITTDKPENHVNYNIQNGVTHLDIFSPSGIGNARIVRASDLAPKEMILNFHLKGLEHLKFSFADQSVEIEIPSHGDHTPRESVPPDSPLYMPVKIFSQGNAFPIENGYVQVELPRAFYESGAREFTIEWIDFYR